MPSKGMLIAATAAAATLGTACGVALARTGPAEPRFVIETDAAVAVRQPGPHQGGGQTTAFPFFDKVSGFETVFRKRILHPGSAIGYHLQEFDEVYYVLSGTGELTMNGESSLVRAGTAILTRPGSHHGLKQVGAEDLVILISYRKR